MSIHRTSDETNKQQNNPRTVLRGVKLQASYSKLALSQKIIMPFLLVFFSIMVISTLSFAYWFSSSMEKQMSNQVEGLTSVVLHSFEQKERQLEAQAQLMADRDDVQEAITAGDTLKILKILVSQKTALELDLLKVVNQNGGVLLDLGQPELGESKLLDKTSISQALEGMNLSDVVKLQQKNGQVQPVLLGLAPVKLNEKAIGAIEIGIVIKDDLLQHLSSGRGEHLVAFNSDKTVIVSTLAIARNANWQMPQTGKQPKRVLIKGKHYLAQSVVSTLSNSSLTLVLLQSMFALNKNVQFLWLRLWGFFVIGALLMMFVGKRTARTISDPVLAVAKVAQQATQEGNFNLQAQVNSKDEVGILAASLNSLIRRVALYTEQLEQGRQTLERRVEERTHQLSQKNQELNQAYDQLSLALSELQLTQAQLIQTEKMSSLGNMVAGVAHEINNPINFIYGNINYAKEHITELLELISLYEKDYPQPTEIIQTKIADMDLNYIIEDLSKILSSMQVGSQRIRQIVLSLRNFSRLDESDMKSVDIHEGINSTLLILNHRLKESIEVFKYYEDLPLVECYPAQLNQVFLNILNNASDALLETKQPQKQIAIHTAIKGDRVCVEIEDNGPGIKPQLKDKIFDPFFTTKDVGKGTGLGLWICYQIIQKHYGNIEVSSVVGQGTKFTITLPLSQSQIMLGAE